MPGCGGVVWLGSVVVARVVLGGCVLVDLSDCCGVVVWQRVLVWLRHS